MAGHSQYANIRFRKDRVDAKRAKTFAKLSRMITVAARQGGGSLDMNARLRLAVEKARVLGMPKDGIERAIKKGTGEGDLGNYEEIVYEGYGPGGVAIMMDILTDNRHRTAADVRIALDKYGGNLGTTGSVAWMFDRRGSFLVDPQPEHEGKNPPPPLTEEQLLEVVVEVGADDLVPQGDRFQILCDATRFAEVQAGLADRGLRLVSADLAYVPSQSAAVADLDVATRLLKLIDALEDNDDVQSVFSNEQLTDAVRSALEES
ncbi:MAG: YebC/PmpR family DNA-binding transcriptional regulator [Planctomycetes bacterium]|nr:YebC/PmpR family DNA-binding transcriptional regulator [Planctomycetota bacterium]